MRLELPWINCSYFGKDHFYSWSLTKLEIKIWKGGKWQISLSKFRNRKESYKYLKADVTCLSTHWNSECYFVENLSKLSAIFWYTLFFLTTFLIVWLHVQEQWECAGFYGHRSLFLFSHMLSQHDHVNFMTIMVMILKRNQRNAFHISILPILIQTSDRRKWLVQWWCDAASKADHVSSICYMMRHCHRDLQSKVITCRCTHHELWISIVIAKLGFKGLWNEVDWDLLFLKPAVVLRCSHLCCWF